jgi:hypothetical protein
MGVTGARGGKDRRGYMGVTGEKHPAVWQNGEFQKRTKKPFTISRILVIL